MWKAMVINCILIVGLFSTVLAQEAAWEKVKDSDGISVYIRKSTDSNVYECKTRGIIKTNVPSFEAMLRDIHAVEEYVINVKDVAVVDVPGYGKSSKDQVYAYARIDMPWPVADRDNIGIAKFTVDPKTGTLFARGHAIKTDYMKRPGVVRCPVNTMSYTTVPIDAQHVELTIHSIIDPGGNIPISVVNFFAKHASAWGFKKLCSIATKEKYKREGPLVTTTLESGDN